MARIALDARAHNHFVFHQPLSQDGFVFVHGVEMRASLERYGPLSDWSAFAASWNDLELDQYLEGRGRFRRRRFGVYAAHCDGTIERRPHQPHYQHREYNALFGGIERWFAPIAPKIGDGPTLRTILSFCSSTFGSLAPTSGLSTLNDGQIAERGARMARRDDRACREHVTEEQRSQPGCPAREMALDQRGQATRTRWHVEVHQFRIEAREDLPGQPTPEGVHRDGVDFVLVLLVNRENIASGVTTVYGGGRPLGRFTLTDPFDAALVDDTRVAHGVTAVAPLDPARPASRDVLVVTFRKS